MFSIPPLPSWDGLHPIVIHFPIAFTFVTPLLILLALLWRKHTGILLLAGTLLMVLAAACAFIATSTGEAAADLVPKSTAHFALLEEHEELGEIARNVILTLASSLLIATATFWKWETRLPRGLVLCFGLLFVIGNLGGVLIVANTAHVGGRLVHEAGIHARFSSNPGTLPLSGLPVPPTRKEKDKDNDD